MVLKKLFKYTRSDAERRNARGDALRPKQATRPQGAKHCSQAIYRNLIEEPLRNRLRTELFTSVYRLRHTSCRATLAELAEASELAEANDVGHTKVLILTYWFL